DGGLQGQGAREGGCGGQQQQVAQEGGCGGQQQQVASGMSVSEGGLEAADGAHDRSEVETGGGVLRGGPIAVKEEEAAQSVSTSRGSNRSGGGPINGVVDLVSSSVSGGDGVPSESSEGTSGNSSGEGPKDEVIDLVSSSVSGEDGVQSESSEGRGGNSGEESEIPSYMIETCIIDGGRIQWEEENGEEVPPPERIGEDGFLYQDLPGGMVVRAIACYKEKDGEIRYIWKLMDREKWWPK
ncbi:hypothetical protein Agub_g15918, partial [Astrephomene gubernaculifera]